MYEQVDDVQVQVECGEYVLLWRDGILMFSTQHHLSVEYNVETKYHGSGTGVDNLHSLQVETNTNQLQPTGGDKYQSTTPHKWQ